MKPLLLSCAILIATVCFAQAPPPSADKLLKDAIAKAGKENKKVFVIFHASWCGPCHKMIDSMNDPSIKKYFTSNFVVINITVFDLPDDANNPGGEALLEKYKGSTSIPYWMIFDKDGKLLADSKMRPPGGGLESGENIGCPAAEQEVDYFIKVLKKTSPLTAAELEKIRKRFRQNE